MADDNEVPPSFLDLDRPLGFLAREYLDALLRGNRARATELILVSVEDGVPVRDIYLDVFQRTQWEVGRLWELRRITVAEEHYCTNWEFAWWPISSRWTARTPSSWAPTPPPRGSWSSWSDGKPTFWPAVNARLELAWAGSGRL